MNKLLKIIMVGLLLCTSMVRADAQKGLEIVQEMDKRDTGFGDSRAELEMILKNRNGDEHVRKLKMKTLEVIGDGDKSLSIFNSPRDIKGTAFLSFTHALEPDEQWLYLPALKRVKRISSSNKSGPFLGSEFAFEDLTSFEVKKYKYNYLGDELLDGIDCFLVESFPQYEHSGYTRLIVWIDKERYIPMKIEFYDRKNALLKTQSLQNYQQYLGQYWRAGEIEMVNHTNGKSTKLVWHNYQFGNGFTDRNFDKNTLKRAR
jgi:outer membrane lipoprotein-sorting protein